ncbi:MAG: DUF4091 domain-containing protein [Chitinophagaceae bacterium]|nr:DUF4091 domain-containing protein [Chitinophagaceae bacterium]
MKVKHIMKGNIGTLLLLLIGQLPFSFAYAQVSAILTDPLEKVFPETFIPVETFKEIDVAKGEVAGTQLVLRSVQNKDEVKLAVEVPGLPDAIVSYAPVGYVRAGREYSQQAFDRLVSNSGFYADPILDGHPIRLQSGQTQACYISVTIPQQAKAGTYPVNISINTGNEILKKSFLIHVHNVKLEKQRLKIANWYTFEAKELRLMNNGKAVELYSELYWKLLKVLAEKMAAYGSNVALASPLELAIYQKKGDQYTFDFSRFDKTVEIFKNAGVSAMLEGAWIGWHSTDWTSNYIVLVPEPGRDTTTFLRLPIQDMRAKNFYAQFFRALVPHLKKKGWWNTYYQHIADEPIEQNRQSYIDIATYVKSLVPDIRIADACHNTDLAETLDLWVPQLDLLNKDYDFYQERKKAGNEVWFYTCLWPRGNYANRFIDLPLIKTRLLHWINYKYDIDGYLHWGFNWWTDDPFAETTFINSPTGNLLPAGDSWIVYPGDHKLYSSIRLEAMRDGINDYTLLKMLEAKNPTLAKKIIDVMVYKFDLYDTSIWNFRKTRKEILTALEEN